MSDQYKDETEIETVVDGFENCTTPKDEFKHRDHLVIAVFYLRQGTKQEALDRMRAGLHRFICHHQVDPAKYKEDLTASWIELVDKTLRELATDMPLLDAVNAVIEELGDVRLSTN